MMKGLMENECGGQNPLMKLTTHFTNNSDHLRTQDAIKSRQNANPTADNFISEYLGIDQKVPQQQHQPRTFQMGRLLNELKQIDSQNIDNKAVCQPISAKFNSMPVDNEWSDEYFSLNNVIMKQSPMIYENKWSTDYLTQSEATIFDEAWDNLLTTNNSNISNNHYLMPSIAEANGETSGTINNNQLNEEMRKTANELLDSMQDSRFSETEFNSFVRNLSQNNQTNSLNDTLDDSMYNELGGSANLNEDENVALNESADLSNEWVREFSSIGAGSLVDEPVAGTFWNDLQDEWNVAASSDPNHPWLDDFSKTFDTYKTYEFDKENPLKSHPNPLAEGQSRLKSYDIVNAVLLFEVAVQAEPNNALAWQFLGTTQVENEQDAQAIRALRRCLDLQPDNLTALSTLATSYTNESMQRLAFYSLIKWLKYHPDYSHILKDDEQAARLLAASETMNETDTPFYMATLSVVHAGDFIDLQEVFLKAVRESSSSPGNIDPNVQCCLGVLFHLSGEYDKAADCFKTALQIKPNDHLLWNKLGATFANSNRNEEAIDAYYQALKLCPGFVRARYNLGIGCMNLGAYKEAVEHFLTALVQQSQATLSEEFLSETTQLKRNNIQQMSETIWSTLRLALSYLNRGDLYTSCLNKDLDHLKGEFKI
jgi:peroxin-5